MVRSEGVLVAQAASLCWKKGTGSTTGGMFASVHPRLLVLPVLFFNRPACAGKRGLAPQLAECSLQYIHDCLWCLSPFSTGQPVLEKGDWLHNWRNVRFSTSTIACVACPLFQQASLSARLKIARFSV
jgi:hypothetical protein